MFQNFIDVWDAIRETGSFFADMCILFITIVTFKRMFFLYKLKIVGFTVHHTMSNGDYFTIDLENRSLSPQIIKKIYLIAESYEIEAYKGYCKIDSFTTKSIDMEPFTKIISGEGKEIKFNTIFEQQLQLKIVTSRDQIYYIKSKTLNKFQQWYYRRKVHKYQPAMVFRSTYNNHVVLDGMQYALDFIDHDNNGHTIFIFTTGLMSESILGVNAIRKEDMKNIETLDAFFNMQFEKLGLKYRLTDLSSLKWKTNDQRHYNNGKI